MEGDVHGQAPLSLGERISAAREAKGWSQRMLARRSGVDRKWIRLLESGDRSNVSLETAKKIAVALDITLGYLAGLEDPEWLPAERGVIGVVPLSAGWAYS